MVVTLLTKQFLHLKTASHEKMQTVLRPPMQLVSSNQSTPNPNKQLIKKLHLPMSYNFVFD